MGISLALLVLSRLEGGAVHAMGFLAPLTVLLFAQRRLRALPAYLAAAAAPVLLFFSFSAYYCGSPLPISGVVKRLNASTEVSPLSSRLAFPNLYNWHAAVPQRLADAMRMDRLARLAGITKPAYYVKTPGYLLFSILLSFAVYCAYHLLRMFRAGEDRWIIYITGYCLAALGLLALNKIVYRGATIPYWYSVTFSIAQLLMLGYILSRMMRTRWKWIVAAFMLLSLIFLGRVFKWTHASWRQWLRDDTKGYAPWYEASLWIRNNTGPQERGAACNAGIIGFCSERQIVNLDGLVNSYEYYNTVLCSENKHPAAGHLERAEFMRKQNVTLFADLTPVDDHDYWRRFFKNDSFRMNLKEVYASKAQSSGLQTVVYRIQYAPFDDPATLLQLRRSRNVIKVPK